MQKILKINENAEKKLYGGMVVDPVISTHGSPIRTYGARLISQSGSCVYFCGLVCGVWLAACLVSLACCGTGSGAGLPGAGSLRRYKN